VPRPRQKSTSRFSTTGSIHGRNSPCAGSLWTGSPQRGTIFVTQRSASRTNGANQELFALNSSGIGLASPIVAMCGEYPADKGKPAERMGRKATGLSPEPSACAGSSGYGSGAAERMPLPCGGQHRSPMQENSREAIRVRTALVC
jgi:hypothetical protein